MAKSTSESAEPPISAARRSEIAASSTLRPPLVKPVTSPLWANSQRPDAYGGVLDSSVGDGAVALRTAARMAPEWASPAIEAKVRSDQMGVARR